MANKAVVDELGLNKMAAKAEAGVSNYADNFFKTDKGFLNAKTKEEISEAVNRMKNSTEVKGYLSQLESLKIISGDSNPKLKAIYDKIEKTFEKGSSPTTATTEGQTKNINHTINFTPTAPYMDVMNREFTKQPDIFNEWAERNVKEFTTPNTAVKN